jgi:hypothetical protein
MYSTQDGWDEIITAGPHENIFLKCYDRAKAKNVSHAAVP